MDTVSKETRSRIMRAIKSSKTSPELALRMLLKKTEIKFEHWKTEEKLRRDLPGSPDLVLPAHGAVIFVDGCFWHCCPSHGSLPKSNVEFWTSKFRKNMERDRRNNFDLTRQPPPDGWTVIRIWECWIKKEPLKVTNMVLKILDKSTVRLYRIPSKLTPRFPACN